MAKNKYNYYLVDGTVLWRQKVDNEYKAEFFSYGEWYEDSIYTAKLEGRCNFHFERAFYIFEQSCILALFFILIL